jgi:hypothetical protein
MGYIYVLKNKDTKFVINSYIGYSSIKVYENNDEIVRIPFGSELQLLVLLLENAKNLYEDKPTLELECKKFNTETNKFNSFVEIKFGSEKNNDTYHKLMYYINFYISDTQKNYKFYFKLPGSIGIKNINLDMTKRSKLGLKSFIFVLEHIIPISNLLSKEKDEIDRVRKK